MGTFCWKYLIFFVKFWNFKNFVNTYRNPRFSYYSFDTEQELVAPCPHHVVDRTFPNLSFLMATWIKLTVWRRGWGSNRRFPLLRRHLEKKIRHLPTGGAVRRCHFRWKKWSGRRRRKFGWRTIFAYPAFPERYGPTGGKRGGLDPAEMWGFPILCNFRKGI